MNNLQQLIKQTEARNKKSSFTVSKYTIDDVITNKNKLEIIYCEDDLTKNYVKLLTDVFSGVFGPVTTRQIESLGDTIKANVDDFKKSYRSKKSVIKEIADGVYIHTSMNSESMKAKIRNVVESFSGEIEWPKDVSDELTHASICADDIISTDNIKKRMYMFQINRENLEDDIDKKITPMEFDRFVKDFDAEYFVAFFNIYEHYKNEWKKNVDKYKREDYLY